MAYIAELNADYERVRHQHANKKATPMVTLARRRAPTRPCAGLWDRYTPARAQDHSAAACSRIYDLAELVPYIDWAPVLPDLGLGRPLPRHPG
jgi:5-methyltetrahydrofolate--homocysteine methyltransferase